MAGRPVGGDRPCICAHKPLRPWRSPHIRRTREWPGVGCEAPRCLQAQRVRALWRVDAGGRRLEERPATQRAEDPLCARLGPQATTVAPACGLGDGGPGVGGGVPPLESRQLSHTQRRLATDAPAAQAPSSWREPLSSLGSHRGQRPCDRQWQPVQDGGDGRQEMSPAFSVQTQKGPERRCWEQTAPEGPDASHTARHGPREHAGPGLDTLGPRCRRCPHSGDRPDRRVAAPGPRAGRRRPGGPPPADTSAARFSPSSLPLETPGTDPVPLCVPCGAYTFPRRPHPIAAACWS